MKTITSEEMLLDLALAEAHEAAIATYPGAEKDRPRIKFKLNEFCVEVTCYSDHDGPRDGSAAATTLWNSWRIEVVSPDFTVENDDYDPRDEDARAREATFNQIESLFSECVGFHRHGYHARVVVTFRTHVRAVK